MSVVELGKWKAKHWQPWRPERILYYAFVDGKVTVVDTVEEWGRSFEMSNRRIAETRVGPWHVSTVFLGIDHNFLGDDPILFETMVFPFDSMLDEYSERYRTVEEARIGHWAAVAHARSMGSPAFWLTAPFKRFWNDLVAGWRMMMTEQVH